MDNASIVILTGAGISAESGISTFRDSGGLWCEHRIEDVATPEGYARDPALVHQFYNLRRAQLSDVKPNAAHDALAELSQKWPGRVLIVTQNVDDLHERAAKDPAGSLLHMHGELKKARCSVSDEVFAWEGQLTVDTPCPCCKRLGTARPHIVWFGEMPLYMDGIAHALAQCALFIAIGSSGQVYPAAGFVHEVRTHGKAHTVELNMEPSSGGSLFHEKIYGPATRIVPEYVQRILAGDIL